jgi:endoglucanase
MERLQVSQDRIVNPQGEPVQLRGVNAGGWMNMESFIGGFPGAEHTLRETMAQVLGPHKAQFFFERWLDHLLGEEDIAFIRSLGANVVRLPLNYRHFEADMDPFNYLKTGFDRLDRALTWCEKYGLYAILDMHAAQGWQNPDWHSDNPTGHALLWKQRAFQDRYVALWREIAERYTGREVIAGYDLLNEPFVDPLGDQIFGSYRGDWKLFNGLYRRVVSAIREVDPDHILFLEGDGFASKFSGIEEPFAENLAYSSHNYNRACWGPGRYPGTHREGLWDRGMVEKVFLEAEGTAFTQRVRAPLWVGEFGPVFNGAAADRPSRLRGFDDTLSVFNQYQTHWTAWTYKDIGVMGWVTVDPASEYLERLAGLQNARRELHTDSWMYWMPPTQADVLVGDLAGIVGKVGGEIGMDVRGIQGRLAKAALAGAAGQMLQVSFARLFQGLSEVEIDRVLQSFALENCQPNSDLLEIARKAFQTEVEAVN